ncbi:MAG: 16S rRNA (uracil(1498)-N(3))-methyltransferase [Bacteroidales bacterium]
MQLFYSTNISGNEIELDSQESQHCSKVLRKGVGDTVYATDGMGNLYITQLCRTKGKNCVLSIISIEERKSARNYKLHIAIAPTKSNDRLEHFVEKSVEFGIDEITPLLCANSERKQVKIERITKTAISAMKQSLQCHLPKINELTTLADIMKTGSYAEKYIAHCQENDRCNISSIKNAKEILFLIGPEGDFSQSEIDKALKNGFTAVMLGQNRLRTETAGIAVSSYFALAQQ